MKILFIYPTMVTEVPMTLAGLSAIAKHKGWETKAVVNTFKRTLTTAEFVNEAISYKADIVAISMITFDVLFTYELIRKLRKAKLYVIVGGAHPTDCPEECLEAGANCVIVGEGEEQFKEILNTYPNCKGGIMQKRERVEINELPLPDLDVFDKELFKGEDGLIKGFHRIYTSRGCPGCCTFCDWKVFGQVFKEYDVKKIVEEIKRRRDVYGINNFSIADDCFTVNRERVIEFCKLIKPLGVQWRANSRANLVDLEMLKEMKDSGCHSIAFGLESGDQETLMKIGKKVTLEDNIKAPKLAHEAGLEVYGCLMVGFPWEDAGHIKNNIKFIKELWNDVSLFQVSGSLMPFPGTAIYRQYSKRYGFENYWLKPEYQQFGIQVYQNALNPLRVSTFYQRYLFDDTYIQKEYFFTYTKEYKKAVRKMVWEIGKHNLLFMFPNRKLKQKFILGLSWLSMFMFDRFPNLEKDIGGLLFSIFHSKDRRVGIEKIRDSRRGIKKSYSNPN
jgi:anaerobic magnesium-protoporphyrin IX monomethyl ester cyclase